MIVPALRTVPYGRGAIYPWAICDVDPKPYRLNSGLFVASRYPIADPEFVIFSVACRDDILAGKVGIDVLLFQSSPPSFS